jgi:hypothetical protein
MSTKSEVPTSEDVTPSEEEKSTTGELRSLDEEVRSLRDQVASLHQELKVLGGYVSVLWQTTGPSGNFRIYFPVDRFGDKTELEEYITTKAPGAHVIAPIEDGKLAGWAYFTCDNALNAMELGKVRWSLSGQHDVFLREGL